MSFENLAGVALGGLIGFLSAYGLESIKNYWAREEDKKKTRRLIEMLYEEVEQIAELIEVDFGLVESEDLSFITGFGKGYEEYDGKLRSTTDRILENNIIFKSQVSKLLEISGYLPNALVRFHTRLQANFGKMDEYIASMNLRKMQEIRTLTLSEAESLKHDMRIFLDKSL